MSTSNTSEAKQTASNDAAIQPPQAKRRCRHHYHDQVENADTSENELNLPAISYENFGLIYSILYDVQSKWYNFGLALGLSPSMLNSIQINKRDQTDECLREILFTRMGIDVKKLTWEDIVCALRWNTVNRNDVAEKIENGEISDSFQFGARGVQKLPGKLTLEELCSLSVEKVWYQLGLWLGIDEQKLIGISGQPKKVQLLFTAFLGLSFSSKMYLLLTKNLSKGTEQHSRWLLQNNRYDEFKHLFSEDKQTMANEVVKMEKTQLLVFLRALVKVGERGIAQKICTTRGNNCVQ